MGSPVDFSVAVPESRRQGEVMIQYAVKILVTSVLVVVIAEAAKRWTLAGALLASLPVTSILAMVWLYWDTKSVEQVSELSYSIFWVVAPSFLFFLVLPLLLKSGLNFWLSLTLSCAVMGGAYFGFVKILRSFGVV